MANGFSDRSLQTDIWRCPLTPRIKISERYCLTLQSGNGLVCCAYGKKTDCGSLPEKSSLFEGSANQI